jgi:hypothetical protein
MPKCRNAKCPNAQMRNVETSKCEMTKCRNAKCIFGVGSGYFRWSCEMEELARSYAPFWESQLGVSRPFDTGFPKCEMQNTF